MCRSCPATSTGRRRTTTAFARSGCRRRAATSSIAMARCMVANRTELAVEVNPQDLPAPGPTRSRELHLLSTVTGMSMDEIRKTLASGSRAAPGGPVILKKGLGVDKVYYLRENQSSFPGVTLQRVFTREYKDGTTAAHLFGNVGEVTARAAQGAALRRAPSGRLGRASRESSTSTTASSAAGPAPTGSRSTPSAGRPQQLRSTAGPARRRRSADDRLRACRATRRGRSTPSACRALSWR